MARLSPLQRAYWLGFRRARQQMRKELDATARRLHDEVIELAAEMTSRLHAEIARLTEEMRATRKELRRSRDAEARAADEANCDRIDRAVRAIRALEQAANERAMIPDEQLH